MRNAFIVSAVRLPTGKFLGTLKEFAAPELGAMVVRESVSRAGIDPYRKLIDRQREDNVADVEPGATAAPRTRP